MSEETSTISDFQTVLERFVFETPSTFSENFAIERFKKKFERPSQTTSDTLVTECWNNWIDYDNSLREIRLPNNAWYKVRELLHRELVPVRFSEVQLPKGSEFDPTRGQNSIEARLCQSRWTCTIDNFSRMAAVCYGHKALKRAVRNRYANWFAKSDFDITQSASDLYLYDHFKQSGSPTGVGLRIFTWKLQQICVITQGSRFSSVPKNNDTRRPINVEPFGNIITQRAVGIHLRAEINRIFSVDLDTLANSHRERIKYVDDIATIDLKNASDSVTTSLCEFLLPKSVFKVIMETRSPMVLGLDRNYHVTKKISSMGNGFTFELMSLILLALCRVYDEEATVFGDDIIIKREYSHQLIADLESVNFQVNTSKSFLDGYFRESCGGNYHKIEGYIESYDFEWPESIGDCVIIWNKVKRLANVYPSFKRLHDSLYRSLPTVLRGGPNPEFEQSDMFDFVGKGWDGNELETSLDDEDFLQYVIEGRKTDDSVFPLFFVTNKINDRKVNDKKLIEALTNIHLDPADFRLVKGYKFVNELRSKTLKHLTPDANWAKYEMYLHGLRRVDDTIRDRGEWVTVWFVTSGERHFRASALKDLTL